MQQHSLLKGDSVTFNTCFMLNNCTHHSVEYFSASSYFLLSHSNPSGGNEKLRKPDSDFIRGKESFYLIS